MGIRDIAVLASRAVLGGYLAAHGAQKLFGTFGGHGIEPTAAAFEGLGLRPGRVTATAAGLSELGGGLLTVAGLASPVGRRRSPEPWWWPAPRTGRAARSPPTGATSPGDQSRRRTRPRRGRSRALLAGRPDRPGLHRVITGIVVAGAVAGAAVNVAMLLRAAPPPPRHPARRKPGRRGRCPLMPAETELWDLIASRREGVLGTIKRSGLPQLSNVLYLPGPGGRTARISTTADRLKARVLARDPRAVLHVTGDSHWAYAVAEGHAVLTPPAAEPGDDACRELLQVHSAFYGPQDQDAFFAEMITRHRLVIRLGLDHVYGVITSAGPARCPPPGARRGYPDSPGATRPERLYNTL